MRVTETKTGCNASNSHGCEFGLEGWQCKYFIHMDFLKIKLKINVNPPTIKKRSVGSIFKK
jgi:hypothetical protein